MIQLESLQCPICLDTFNNPTTLACGHSFCIEHLPSLKIPTGVIPTTFSLKCPYCAVVHVYERDLSINFTLKSIIEELGNKPQEEKKILKMENIPKVETKMVTRRIKEDGLWGRETMMLLQQYLTAHGEPLAFDGFFGEVSVCALQSFIGTYGILPVDGLFGEMTSGGLQKYLQQSGFSPGTIDGFFGKKSTKALQKWLNHEKGQIQPPLLLVDGIFGKHTSTVFQSVLTTKGYDTGGVDGRFGKMSVRALQRLLNDNGCCFIMVDGVWGNVTTIAVQVWLKKNNEQPGPVDGNFGPESCLALQRLLNKWIMEKNRK